MMAEDGFDWRAGEDDLAGFVDGDDGVAGGFYDNAVLLFTAAQRRFGLNARRHVGGGDKLGRASKGFNGNGRDFDGDEAAVLFAMTPGSICVNHRTMLAYIGEQIVDVRRRANIAQRHGEELLAGVAVVADG